MNDKQYYKCSQCKDKGWLWDVTDKFYIRESRTDKNGQKYIYEEGTAVVLCTCEKGRPRNVRE